MGFDGKCFGKNGKGIQNPIEICIRKRNESIGCEGKKNNGDTKFVKEETVFTDSSATKHMQKQEQYCSHCGRKWHVQSKCWNCIFAIFVLLPIIIITPVGKDKCQNITHR